MLLIVATTDGVGSDGMTCLDSLQILTLLRNICETGAAVVMSTHNLALINLFPGVVYRCKDNMMTEITDEFNRPFDMDELSLLNMAENAKTQNGQEEEKVKTENQTK